MTDIEFAAAWLKKAAHDLEAAQRLFSESESLADVVCFHAQQAIEKSFKGVCTAHSVPFEKTHDLVSLLELVRPFMPLWEKERTLLGDISGYAVDVRYPDEVPPISVEMTRRALGLAAQIVDEARRHVENLSAKSKGESP